jgi:hypothetical protein
MYKINNRLGNPDPGLGHAQKCGEVSTEKNLACI